ncbi:MAG TPA: efflux RND transporter permease subunit [Verrucomicrobiales bacterium]|nr:efflux RND transporter permease subunit [Verrucomicrobiales bacterium]
MNLIDASLKNGTAVVVAMIMLILFGMAALRRIPVQLNPTIDRPIVTVRTDYPGAAALEVESEITYRQEQRLATVQNLRRITSSSEEGEADIDLEFEWGIDKDVAVIDINTKLGSVRELPDEARKPLIYAADSEDRNSIIRISVLTQRPSNQVREMLEETIVPQLERVKDVGRIWTWGGSRRQIQVLLDLTALDSRNLTISEVRRALDQDNQNRRGGDIEEGNSRFLVRTVGQYTNLDEIRRTVIKNTEGGVIRIEDIAEVKDDYEDPDSFGRSMGKPSISLNITKVTGANTIAVAQRLVAEVEKINAENEVNDIQLWVNYNAADYIWNSIFRVCRNLVVGALLATIVLFLFLRSLSSTFAIAVTIPICLIGTFVLLAAFDRSVNVISLAGLAFAAGMVVDNAVVVMENIFRHKRELGAQAIKAAREGTKEVWAPVLASSLTTVIVFIPILFIREEAGQLFRDIAYSISFAVGISMMATMFASRLLKKESSGYLGPSTTGPDSPSEHPGKVKSHSERNLMIRGALLIRRFFLWLVSRGIQSKPIRMGIFASVAFTFFLSLGLVPPAEYLPQSKSASMHGRISNPTGMSLEGADYQLRKIEDYILNKVDHLYRTYSWSRRSSSYFGIYLQPEYATSDNADVAIVELENYAAEVLPSDFRFSVDRGSSFGRRTGGKRVELEITGPELDYLQLMSLALEDKLQAMPEVKQVSNSFSQANPELQVFPDRERLADLNMKSQDIADTVETILEGTRASYYRKDGKEYEIILKARIGQILHSDNLRDILIATPAGGTVRLGEIAEVEKRLGPAQVDHIDKERAISLRITIQNGVALQTFMAKARNDIIKPFQDIIRREYGADAVGYQARLAGTADDLERTMAALSKSFLFALLISYLLMTALFQSFFYPLIILFSVPLAMSGGFLGIWAMGSEFNVITMLGFVLLAGIVVNNAILLIDFSLRSVRSGVELHKAALEAVRIRIRPIFMTSMTTALGMIPLALGRGVGSELYSGLGTAVVGGMILSTIFTLILIPLLLVSALELREAVVSRLSIGKTIVPSRTGINPS